MPWSNEPPPEPGWYNATTERQPDVRRYWNGRAWSAPCYSDDPMMYHERARYTADDSPQSIEWRSLAEALQ